MGDPGAETEVARQGIYPFPVGQFFTEGPTIGMGQDSAKGYNRYPRDLIVAGRAVPGQIVSHGIPLNEAPGAYDGFDRRVDGYAEVVTNP